MANPQVEDGYTKIANEILEILSRVNLPAYEMRVLILLLRKTYGWKKKRDWISISQFLVGTGLPDRRYVHRALKGLENKNIVVICRDDKKHPTYGFQKDYERWKLPSLKDDALRRMTTERRKRKSACRDDTLSSVEAPTKETITKKIVKEKEESNVSSSLVLSSSLKPENHKTPAFKEKKETPFSGLCNLLDSPNALKEELKNRGYRLSDASLKMLVRRLREVADEKGDISDADIERVTEEEIIGYAATRIKEMRGVQGSDKRML